MYVSCAGCASLVICVGGYAQCCCCMPMDMHAHAYGDGYVYARMRRTAVAHAVRMCADAMLVVARCAARVLCADVAARRIARARGYAGELLCVCGCMRCGAWRGLELRVGCAVDLSCARARAVGCARSSDSPDHARTYADSDCQMRARCARVSAYVSPVRGRKHGLAPSVAGVTWRALCAS